MSHAETQWTYILAYSQSSFFFVACLSHLLRISSSGMSSPMLRARIWDFFMFRTFLKEVVKKTDIIRCFWPQIMNLYFRTYMFWNGFYTRKSNFLDNHLQEAGPSRWSFTTMKRAWKMHFWDHSQWDKTCFEYQRIKFNGKNGSKFSHLLMVRAKGADPHPPPRVSLTVKYPGFFMTSLKGNH